MFDSTVVRGVYKDKEGRVIRVDGPRNRMYWYDSSWSLHAGWEEWAVTDFPRLNDEVESFACPVEMLEFGE